METCKNCKFWEQQDDGYCYNEVCTKHNTASRGHRKACKDYEPYEE